MRTFYLTDGSRVPSLYKWSSTQNLCNLHGTILLHQVSLKRLRTEYFLTVIDFRVLLSMEFRLWERLPLKEILNDILKEIS